MVAARPLGESPPDPPPCLAVLRYNREGARTQTRRVGWGRVITFPWPKGLKGPVPQGPKCHGPGPRKGLRAQKGFDPSQLKALQIMGLGP